MSAWTLTGLTKRYRRWLGAPHTAVDDVSLSVAPGERIALIGESGSGKTTLVRAGLGLIGRDAGRIEVLGRDVTRWSRRDWMGARREVQLLLQDAGAMLSPNLPIDLLLRESAALHRPELDPRREAARVLDEVGLSGRGDALGSELSGGERRRAGLARVLLARPRLLVADEPTSGLDAALKASLVALLLERLDPACAVVLVSHDLPTVAWATHRVIVLQGGRRVDELSADALRSPTAPRHPHTAALMRAAGLPTPPPPDLP